MSETIVVERGTKPCWTFTRAENGHFECKQRKYTYRLFFQEKGWAPVWVGVLLDNAVIGAHHIGVTAIRFTFGAFAPYR